MKKDRSEDSQRYDVRRRLGRNGKKIAMILLSVLFLFVLAMAVWGMGAHHQDLTRLAQEGKVVSAQVTARSESSGRYSLEYEFDAEGQRIDGMESVSRKVYQNTPSAGYLKITYVPADPRLRQLGTVTQANVAADRRSMFWALSCLTLFFASALWAAWRCYPEPHDPYPVIFNEP